MVQDPEVTLAQIGHLEISPNVLALIRQGFRERVGLHARAAELKPHALQAQDQALMEETRSQVMAQVESDVALDDGRFDSYRGQILKGPAVRFPDADTRKAAEQRNVQAMQTAAALSAEIAVERDPRILQQRMDDGLLLKNNDATRQIASAVIGRLEKLAEAERDGKGHLNAIHPATDAADAMRRQFSLWRRDHPTDGERLAAIEEDRKVNRFTKTRDADTVLRTFGYGSTRPMPGGITIGRAWERGPQRPWMPPVGDPRRTSDKKAAKTSAGRM